MSDDDTSGLSRARVVAGRRRQQQRRMLALLAVVGVVGAVTGGLLRLAAERSAPSPALQEVAAVASAPEAVVTQPPPPAPVPSPTPVTVVGPFTVEPGDTALEVTPFQVEVVSIDCREEGGWSARVGLTNTGPGPVPGAGLVVELDGAQARADVWDVPPGSSVHVLHGDGACPRDAGTVLRTFLAWCA